MKPTSKNSHLRLLPPLPKEETHLLFRSEEFKKMPLIWQIHAMNLEIKEINKSQLILCLMLGAAVLNLIVQIICYIYKK